MTKILEHLHLKNFRCFADHRVPFRATTLIVGRNNAGKSTIIEALRLVSLIANKRGKVNYRAAPEWTGLRPMNRGLAPSLAQMGFDFRTVFHHYSQPPAEIIATFSSGDEIKIYIGPNRQIFATIKLAGGTYAKSKAQANAAEIPSILALPQIGPLSDEETILAEDYVRKNTATELASRHFRNQIRLYAEDFDGFKRLAEESWPSLQITPLVSKNNLPGDLLGLRVRDGAFVGEVATMGHGLQMWLQTMWFLARSPLEGSVILDEPDVYMHPDLQRRLIQVAVRRHQQVIVATHSIEIMAEVAPSDILIVDKGKPESSFANSLSDVQTTIDRIGGISNIELVRLWSAKRLLIVEGEDVYILRHLHRTLFPGGSPLDDIPHMTTGGWGNWGHAIGSRILLENSGGERILPYCIFDSDYHLAEEIEKRYREAQERRIHLHVWRRKELENYLLDSKIIARTIFELSGGYDSADAIHEQVATQLDVVLTGLRDQVEMSCADTLSTKHRGWQPTTLLTHARKFITRCWQQPDGPESRVPGKTALSELSRWSAKHFRVGLSPQEIARRFKRDEIPEEIARVLKAIEAGTSFPASDTLQSVGWLSARKQEDT